MRLFGFLGNGHTVCCINVNHVYYDDEENILIIEDLNGYEYMIEHLGTFEGLALIQHLAIEGWYRLDGMYKIIFQG